MNARTITPPKPVDPSRSERRARLQALIDSAEWQQLVASGLRAQRKRVMETVAMGTQLPEPTIRGYQARYALLNDLLLRPVETLIQFDDDKGDDR